MWNTFLFFYNSSLLRKRKQNNKIKYLTSHLQGRGALYSMHYKSWTQLGVAQKRRKANVLTYYHENGLSCFQEKYWKG